MRNSDTAASAPARRSPAPASSFAMRQLPPRLTLVADAIGRIAPHARCLLLSEQSAKRLDVARIAAQQAMRTELVHLTRRRLGRPRVEVGRIIRISRRLEVGEDAVEVAIGEARKGDVDATIG